MVIMCTDIMVRFSEDKRNKTCYAKTVARGCATPVKRRLDKEINFKIFFSGFIKMTRNAVFFF